MQAEKIKLQKTLAEIIQKLRNKKSITQLANEIDLSKSVWFNLEKGERDIQFSTFWRIAEGLDIKPSDLVKEIENQLGEDFSFIENEK